MRRFIHSNGRPILEIGVLIIAFTFPFWSGILKHIEAIFLTTDLGFNNLKYFYLLQGGNLCIAICLTCFVLVRIRKYNKDKLFNTTNNYHDYFYVWYLFCAKVLGYRKCNMKLVPIYMQFKLVLKDTFEEYIVGTNDDYCFVENELIEVINLNSDEITNKINLVLCDTYPITEEQLPQSSKDIMTIIINRNKGDFKRYYSPNFVAKIVNIVRTLPVNMKCINLYATTNPKHTVKIANDVFKLADRGNIKKLVVFQQQKEGRRAFNEKGKLVFDKL